MIKKLVKLFFSLRGVSYGPRPYKPWKDKRWKAHKRARHHTHIDPRYGYPPFGQPPGYGGHHAPYGGHHHRPRSIKGMVVEAILHKLAGRR